MTDETPLTEGQLLDLMVKPLGSRVQPWLTNAECRAILALRSGKAWVAPVEATEGMIRQIDSMLHEHWPNARKMAHAAWTALRLAATGGEE